jgi:hypothetical protein
MPQTTSLKNSEIKFTLSTKGKRVLIYEGYRYILNQKKNGKKYWRCEDGSACRAYVHTTSDDIYINHNDNQHNHFPDPDEILITGIIEKIRYRVINEHLSAGLIYENEVARAKFTQSQLARMPSFKSLSNLKIWFLIYALDVEIN